MARTKNGTTSDVALEPSAELGLLQQERAGLPDLIAEAVRVGDEELLSRLEARALILDRRVLETSIALAGLHVDEARAWVDEAAENLKAADVRGKKAGVAFVAAQTELRAAEGHAAAMGSRLQRAVHRHSARERERDDLERQLEAFDGRHRVRASL